MLCRIKSIISVMWNYAEAERSDVVTVNEIKDKKVGWDSCSSFLKFSYAQQHIQDQSSIRSHCSQYILGHDSGKLTD